METFFVFTLAKCQEKGNRRVLKPKSMDLHRQLQEMRKEDDLRMQTQMSMIAEKYRLYQKRESDREVINFKKQNRKEARRRKKSPLLVLLFDYIKEKVQSAIESIVVTLEEVCALCIKADCSCDIKRDSVTAMRKVAAGVGHSYPDYQSSYDMYEHTITVMKKAA